MTPDTSPPSDPATRPMRQVQTAEFHLAAGPVSLTAGVRLTPMGFIAIGSMVASILLGASCVVWAATSAARRRAARG